MQKAQSRTRDLIERKAQFSIGLPGRQFTQLTQLAKQDGRSRSDYCADVLSRHLDRLERKAA